jgi:uncharacterized damage-inducible protein DinB
MMTSDCIQSLKQLQALLEVVPATAYTHASPILSGATIGEHTRHVVEFYQCLLSQIQYPGATDFRVNYDLRKRSFELEQNSNAAADFISELCEILHQLGDSDLPLQLEGWYCTAADNSKIIQSSLQRELLYNLEHSIHHQALIRAGLIELNLQHLLPADFGVAPSTLRAKMS